jgi:hypothetical protein
MSGMRVEAEGMDSVQSGAHQEQTTHFSDRQDEGGRRGSTSESKHTLYAVEILVFAFVGWGWLSIREYLGRTPVMDVVVSISVLTYAFVNMAAAVLIPSSLEFAPFASAYFSQCLVLWVVYVYSLSESLRTDATTLCCKDASGVQSSTYSIGPTHANAFFGGLPLHQVPSMGTVAFLTVELLIAGAQGRACELTPTDLIVRGLGLSITSLVVGHLGVFLLGTPSCSADSDQILAAVLLTVSVLSVILMVDFDWVIGWVYSFFLKRERSVQQRRDHRVIRSTIQAIGMIFCLVLCLAIAMVVENSVSIPLLVVCLVLVIACLAGLGYEVLTLYGSKKLDIKAWTPSGVDSQARVRLTRGRIGQEMRVPSHMTRGPSGESRTGAAQVPILRRFPIFLQGQANRWGKSY